MDMDFRDDDLERFEREGPAPLPETVWQGYVDCDGARIWCAEYGRGAPVILLHGGMGNAGNWGYQVPVLAAAGRRVVVIDSRGHGRSTRDTRPFSYEQMATDVFAVMDGLGIERAPIVGWSDGAVTGLVMAKRAPERIAGVFFFACNVDETGTFPFEMTPEIERCINRHRADYTALSSTPEAFDAFGADLGKMQQTQPNYTAADLAAIGVPVMVAQSEFEQFIRPEHARYIAASIPGAGYVELPGVSHFAPVQRPAEFSRVVLDWLERLRS